MPKIDRSGHFLAEIIPKSREMVHIQKTGTIFAKFVCAITDWWNEETESWEDWQEFDMEADAFLCLVKKDGTLNESQIKALGAYAGWDGDWGSFDGWTPTPIRIDVQFNSYGEEGSFQVSWVNDHSTTPSSGVLSTDEAEALKMKHGASVRAIIGNVERTATPPKGKPAKPPKPQAASADVGDGDTLMGEVPF